MQIHHISAVQKKFIYHDICFFCTHFTKFRYENERMGTMFYYIMYLRKSRADDPNESIDEVLAKHERILQNYALLNYKSKIPEENIYREVVSGETIDDCPEINHVFERIQDKECRGVLVVDPQRLSRGDLIDCGTILRLFKYTNTLIVTPRSLLIYLINTMRKALKMN